MDKRINPDLDDEPVKGRGRPRKIVSDVGSSETVSELPAVSSGQREATDGIEPGPVLDTWPNVAKLAIELSEKGRLVTQLHTTGQSVKWAFWSVGAASHSNSDGNYVVTSDGEKHSI